MACMDYMDPDVHCSKKAAKLNYSLTWVMQLYCHISDFQTHIKDRYLENFMWNIPQVNAPGPDWWLFNIGSGNGLVHDGTKPLPQPMLTKFNDYLIVVLWRHMAT